MNIPAWKIARLNERAAAMADDAVGKPYRVRMSKTGVLAGEIIGCHVKGLRYRGASVVVQFDVIIRSATGAVGTATVETLPR